MKLRVKCEFYIDIEYPNKMDSPNPYFQIEENECPGTGMVWLELQKQIEMCRQESICWACKLQGSNKIVHVLEDR